MSKSLNDVALEHIGTPHQGPIPHSGRYKYGSGEKPFQRATEWRDVVAKHRANGLNDTEIARKLGLTTTEFRNRNTIASQTVRKHNISMIQTLADKGLSSTEISKQTGIPEASVRMNLNKKVQNNVERMDKLQTNLKDLVDKYDHIDIGRGAAQQLGVVDTTLKRAVAQLVDSGEYYQHEVYVKDATNDAHWVTYKVLTKEPNAKRVSETRDKIKPPLIYEDESGVTHLGLKPIKHIGWDKIGIKYDEDGGTDKDGVIQIRPGAKDLDLGNAKYAQVRISVNGTHYLKGMAVYGDPKDFPKGQDIIFNTNKKRGTPPEKVLKEMKTIPGTNKIDWDNPFGATIKPNGQKGAINKVNEEGDWNNWSRTLSSQFLSKQPTALVKERINDTYSLLKKEYDEINSLTNPMVKKKLLTEFVDGLDTKRRSLKLVGISGMRGHVLLPVSGMKANEIYAPNYKDGTKVVLVRYPHGGIFELPELTVNNKLGKGVAKFMKNAKDAVGIDSSVAQKLSGADFDGDTVMVIPNNSGKIKTARSLKELKNFEPKAYYSPDPKILNRDANGNWKQKQNQMGTVSNLITDMTIKGASQSEIARAVKHSMVVIDAEKHNLDVKRSERDNDIPSLKRKYQKHTDIISGKVGYGASTLISRSKQTYSEIEKFEVSRSKEQLEKNPRLKPTIKKQRTLSTTPIVDMVTDAKKLGSGSPVENLYGNYINALTKLGNEGRKKIDKIPNIKTSKEARQKYKTQLQSLDEKLNHALTNQPRERQAQLLAARTIAERRTPNMQDDQLKKLKSQAIAAARVQTGASGKKSRIHIEDDEWEAIQSGAISSSKLAKILYYSDPDHVRRLATPRKQDSIPLSKVSRVKNMLANGYSYSDIASATGISISSVQSIAK